MVEGFIFDVDGVLVDSPHERAWGDTLRYLMENEWPELMQQTGYRPQDYTSAVYQTHVAGKPRSRGAAALLAHFQVPDPDGSRCALLCGRKQDQIVDLIEREEFEAFGDALRFLVKAKSSGARVAAAVSDAPETQYLFANSGGYGFIAKVGDLVSRQKAGKGFMSLEPGERVLLFMR